LTPVIAVRRWAMSSARRAAVSTICSAMYSRAWTNPPRASTAWNCCQARCHAGKAARDRHVEREHQHGVGAADPRAESGHRAAQHVHPRIAPGHHRHRGLRVNDGRPALRVADDLGDTCPQPARGAQLGDRHELVVVGGQPEADLP